MFIQVVSYRRNMTFNVGNYFCRFVQNANRNQCILFRKMNHFNVRNIECFNVSDTVQLKQKKNNDDVIVVVAAAIIVFSYIFSLCAMKTAKRNEELCIFLRIFFKKKKVCARFIICHENLLRSVFGELLAAVCLHMYVCRE